MNTITKLLKNSRIILASKSPRRIKLLQSLGITAEIIPANIDESAIPISFPAKYCKTLALEKAKHVALTHATQDSLIIAADTIVVLDGEILGKPKDEQDAIATLKKLSNRCHFVYTGVALFSTQNRKTLNRYARTAVSFRKLDEKEICEYVATGSPMDKAGSYGIQDDYGALFVKRIEGCYNNVIGLPLEMLYNMMKECI